MIYCLVTIFITSSASFSLRQAGWLDRVVEYHKNKLFEDFRKIPAVQIKARLEPLPPGYVDSTAWDFDSVMRLLTLIRESEMAQPLRRALRKILGSRRMMSFQESVKAFPSLSKDLKTYVYYNLDSGEYYGDLVTEDTFVDDEAVIVVSNPVEARLPSAKISVNLLREILESRAKAARYMPTTPKVMPWSPMKKPTASNITTASTAAATTAGSDAATAASTAAGTAAGTDAGTNPATNAATVGASAAVTAAATAAAIDVTTQQVKGGAKTDSTGGTTGGAETAAGTGAAPTSAPA